MFSLKTVTKPLMWSMAILLVVLTAGCGDPKGPILGAANVGLPPTVTAVAPLNNAVNVPINSTVITANFSEPMSPLTGAATFTVTCGAPCVSPTGPVTLDATNIIATFGSTTALTPLTLYTATITGATSLATGLALASPYTWSFTTGLRPDTTKPGVLSTIPVTTTPGLLPAPGVATVGVPTNTAITATFTEDMAPASISATSFTLTGPGLTPVPVAVIPVTYAVGSRTATFIPATPLAPLTTYTATIKGTGASVATDLAGNILAGDPALPLVANDYVWSFITAAAALPPVPVTAVINSPLAGAINVCPSATISATFSVPMDTIPTTAAFTLADAALNPVPGTAALDPTLMIATFTPLNPLVNGTTYTATIKGGATGVKDLAIPANTMAADLTRTFTAGPATGACLPPVNPGALATFGIASFSGITDVGASTVNGDVVIDTGLTCNAAAVGVANDFGANCNAGANTITNNAGDLVITQTYPDTTSADAVMVALTAKWNSISPAGVPLATVLGCGTIGTAGGAGAGIGCAGNSTLPPGAYISATNSTIGVTGSLTLDAGGNPDATWIFQAPSALSANVGSQIILIGGAKASNVWWFVGSSATLFTNSIFNGNILASASITMQNLATSCGRLLSGAAGAGAFVFDTNVVSVPGHPNAPLGCQ